MLMSNKSRGVFIVAIVCAATAMCTGIGQYAFGYFIEPLEQTFGWSRTEISASLSFAAVTGLAAPFFGRDLNINQSQLFCDLLPGNCVATTAFQNQMGNRWIVPASPVRNLLQFRAR